MKIIALFFVLFYFKIFASDILIPFRDGNKWGFCDEDKKILIKPQFDSVNVFNEERAVVYLKGFCGYIDSKGKKILPIKYYGCSDFYDDYASIIINYNSIFVNKSGNYVSKINNSAIRVHNGLVAISELKNEKYLCGYKDSTGKIIVPIRYDEANFVCNEDTCLAFIRENDSIFLLNRNWDLIYLKCKYIIGLNSRYNLIDEYFTCIDDSGYFFINNMGQILNHSRYRFSYGFYNGYGLVGKENISKSAISSRKIFYVDKDGNELYSDNYIAGGLFNENRAFVVKSLSTKQGEVFRYGYIDKSGKVIIPIKYCIYNCDGKLTNWPYRNNSSTPYTLMFDNVLQKRSEKSNNTYDFESFFWDAYDFHEGLARFFENNLAGYIDTSGNIKIAPQFEMSGYFQEGLAPIKVKNKYGFINFNGEIIIKPKYNEVSYFKNGISKIKVGNKFGYIGKNGVEYFCN
jgi:hypothetical protein